VASAPPPVAPTLASRPNKSGPRVTWRAGAGLLLMVGVVAAFFYIMHWYAYSTYYLAPDGKYIGVYAGQPNGVLWYKPKLASRTMYLSAQLEPSALISLKATISEPSVASAWNYAGYLHGLWVTSQSSGVTTTTTTTTTVKAKG